MVVPFSVFIITKNEADRIERAIKSVIDIADEVIVIDSGSTDETVALAEKCGAKTLYRQWEGYGPQKVYGEKLCKNDWVLNIDADEYLTTELQEHLKKMFSDKSNLAGFSAFKIRKVNIFFNEERPNRLSRSFYLLRLYNKKRGGFKSSTVHDSVLIKSGKVGKIKIPMVECSIRSYTHWVEKINNYTSMQAKDCVKRGVRYSPLLSAFMPILGFFKFYILRGFWAYGLRGIGFSYVASFSRLLKTLKTQEEYRKIEKKSTLD